jgi:hypothetical protein
VADSHYGPGSRLSNYEYARKNENNRFEEQARQNGLRKFFIEVDLTRPWPKRTFIHPDDLTQYLPPSFFPDDCDDGDDSNPNRISKIYS